MKKILASLSLIVTMGSAGMAMAVPYSWTDAASPGVLLKEGESYTYIHDITNGPNGFVPLINDKSPYDFLADYSLLIGLDLYDITKTFTTEAKILVSTIAKSPTEYNFDFTNDNNDYSSLLGWMALETTGKLKVTIKDTRGSFYFKDSVLTASGLDNTPAPVPEPGTMVLLGAGLLGLAIYGKRRMNNKED